MSEEKIKIRELVYEAIDELNEMRAPQDRLQKQEQTVLYGSQGSLDSLGLVNISVSLEGRLEKHFGYAKSLFDFEDDAKAKEAFRTVETLTRHIEQLLREENGG